MTSFAFDIEPAAQPRLAAAALLAHGFAAAAPWLARVEPPIAVALSALASAGLAATLTRVPGSHCPLAALAFDSGGCRARLAGSGEYLAARLTPAARAGASFASVEVVVAGRRIGWLLPRGSLPADSFRRLKARIRLTC